jgi:hypothetical protein
MSIVSSRPAGPATTERHLQKIVAHFVRHNPGLEKLDLQIHLSDSDEVNAFAFTRRASRRELGASKRS